MFLLRTLCTACGTLFIAVNALADTNSPLAVGGLTLEQAVQQAIANDPWLAASQQKESSALARSNAFQSLPDPKFNLGFMNFPTDTFNYGQEAMTQVAVGVSQALPRGDTLALNSQMQRLESEQMPLMREERRAQVRLTVTQLWLDALKASLSSQLIEDNRILFEQLSDIVGSSYSSAFGKARQQDLVRSQLELDQLDERLMLLQQQQSRAEQQLGEWLSAADSTLAGTVPVLNQDLPELMPPRFFSQQALTERLSQHPSLRLIEQSVRVAQTKIDIAEQQYKPEWMINASYGFRGDDAMGNDRADLFSVGVSVDMPIFSSQRQDSQVRAETYAKESLRTERLLKLRNLLASYQTLEAELKRLDQRSDLYQNKLLPGLHQSAEASINAYTVDDGSFAEVVQARMSELEAKLAQLSIQFERRKKIAEMQYLLVGYQQETN